MKTYKNISGLEFEVVQHLGDRKALVRFTETGSLVKCWAANMAAGKVSDPFHKSRLGVGYLGHFEKNAQYKQAYQLWSNMLKRCYDPNDKRGYYGSGVVVDPSWHCFANFQKDICSLVGYSNWSNKEGFDIDKDLIGDGKTYSKETCWFVKSSVNRAAGKGNKTKVDGVWVTTTS